MRRLNKLLKQLDFPKNKREKLTRDRKSSSKQRSDSDSCKEKRRSRKPENSEKERKGKREDCRKKRKIGDKENYCYNNRS